jgi:elongation factor 2
MMILHLPSPIKAQA